MKRCPADILALEATCCWCWGCRERLLVEPTVGPRHCWALLAGSKSGQVRRPSLRGPYSAGQTQGLALHWEAPHCSPCRPPCLLPGSRCSPALRAPARAASRGEQGRSVSLHAPRVHGHPGPAEALCQEVEGGAGMPEGGPRISIQAGVVISTSPTPVRKRERRGGCPVAQWLGRREGTSWAGS